MQSPLLALSSLARWQLRSTGGNERIAEISLRIIVLIQKYALFDIADITFSDFIAHKLLN